MGRASSLKRIRKYSTNEIDDILKQLDEKDIDNDKVFKICGDALKLVEVHFRVGRKDNKMYNKYRKQIHDTLYNRIFYLGLVKEKDRGLTIKTLKKKDNDFLYVLLMTEFQYLGQLYEVIRKNVSYEWLKFENGEVLPELNLQSNVVKNNPDKILNHLKELYKSISVEEIISTIRDDKRYSDYKDIIKDRLTEMKAIEHETFEQSFYRYAFEELGYLYSDVMVMSKYVHSYMDVLSKLSGESEESPSAL